MRLARSLPLLTLGAVVLVACGGSGGTSTGSLKGEKIESETGRKAVTVEAVDNAFDPKFSSVSKGTTVTFENTGHNPHNVISVGDGFGRSKVLAPGERWKVTLEDAGDFRFYCSLHGTATSGMDGGVRVEG